MLQFPRSSRGGGRRYVWYVMCSITALLPPPHNESVLMSGLAKFRQLEQRFAAQFAELEALNYSSEL